MSEERNPHTHFWRPKPMSSIYHVTLNTGDVTMVPETHLLPHTIPVMDELLRVLYTHNNPYVPGHEGWFIGQRRPLSNGHTSIMLSTEYRSSILPVAWLGICKNNNTGQHLWKELHMPGQVLLTNENRVPKAPWLASRIINEDIIDNDIDLLTNMRWIADFSECLAIAWLKTQERRQEVKP